MTPPSKAERDAMRAVCATIVTRDQRGTLAGYVRRLLDHIERPIAGVTAEVRHLRKKTSAFRSGRERWEMSHADAIAIDAVLAALEAPPPSEGLALAALRRLVAAAQDYRETHGNVSANTMLDAIADARALLKRGAERPTREVVGYRVRAIYPDGAPYVATWRHAEGIAPDVARQLAYHTAVQCMRAESTHVRILRIVRVRPASGGVGGERRTKKPQRIPGARRWRHVC